MSVGHANDVPEGFLPFSIPLPIDPLFASNTELIRRFPCDCNEGGLRKKTHFRNRSTFVFIIEFSIILHPVSRVARITPRMDGAVFLAVVDEIR